MRVIALVISMLFLTKIAVSEPMNYLGYPEESLIIYKMCSEKNKGKIREFEKMVSFKLIDIINLEVGKMRRGDTISLSQKDATDFCNSLMGKKYGKVHFTSTPTNGGVMIGDEKVGSTEITLINSPGNYKYKVTTSKKECSGSFEIIENKTTPINCE